MKILMIFFCPGVLCSFFLAGVGLVGLLLYPDTGWYNKVSYSAAVLVAPLCGAMYGAAKAYRDCAAKLKKEVRG